MVSIFGFSARDGRPLATQLGNHSLGIPAGDMDAHRARTWRNGGPMEIALTTNSRKPFASASAVVLWKAWQESRGRFFSALVLLASVVIYAVVTGPGYL